MLSKLIFNNAQRTPKPTDNVAKSVVIASIKIIHFDGYFWHDDTMDKINDIKLHPAHAHRLISTISKCLLIYVNSNRSGLFSLLFGNCHNPSAKTKQRN